MQKPSKYTQLITLIQNLLENPTNECVTFDEASYTQAGYGMVTHNGKSTQTHKIALEIKLGAPIRKGYEVAHSCNNRGCISPWHLSEKTHAQNIADRYIHGTASVFLPPSKKTTKTGYKGVCQSANSYVTKFIYNGRDFYIGTFKTAEAAALAYDKAILRQANLHLKPYLNFPEVSIPKD